jgi:hypothetical protein
MTANTIKRPTGVTIIAILNIIGGIIMLIGGIAAAAVGAVLPSLPISESDLSGVPPMFLGAGAIAIGVILIIIGILSFVVAYGLLKGMGWAWTLTLVLSIISIVLNAISIASGNFGGIISIIISAIIVYYLYRPHVKAFFGKGTGSSKPNT